ncbi:hypothetical protein MPSEU_000029900 [Mayamaea pseudoterrestris]|nr:hypothetical protein MPSEU_000029900 [Mayamaea pseudoterrestris]
MPWKTLCGFPPTNDTFTLLIPNGRWQPDTVITDEDGNEIFVLIDQTQEMRSYEAVFGDMYGRRLVCVKRHLVKAFWQDGYYFCTYQPNYPGQRALKDTDCENKKVYPFGYLEVYPLKGRYVYRLFGSDEKLRAPRMVANNPWYGFMTVCCTPIMRSGSWTCTFRRIASRQALVHVDQWRNCVVVGPGQDLLMALCMAYVFDRAQCQPLVTTFGRDDVEDEYEDGTRPVSNAARGGQDDGGRYKDEPVNDDSTGDDLRLNEHDEANNNVIDSDDDNDSYSRNRTRESNRDNESGGLYSAREIV